MIISQNVPICPDCSAMMVKRHQNNEIYFFCADCKSIYQVIDNGTAEIELIVTDGKETDGEISA